MGYPMKYPPGLFIRDRLRLVKRDYPYRIWKAYIMEHDYPISYRSFYVYFYWLRKLGLIRPVESVASKKGFDRVFYELTEKGMEASDDVFARPYYYFRLMRRRR